MRAFSVVFIFATLAIFGAMAQELTIYNCEKNCNDYPEDRLCASVNGDEITFGNICEFNNMKDCATAQRNAGERYALVKGLHSGGCIKPTSDNCKIKCPHDIEPVCFTLNGELQSVPNDCVLRSYIRCSKAQWIEKGDGSKIEFVGVGECPGHEGLMTVGWFGK